MDEQKRETRIAELEKELHHAEEERTQALSKFNLKKSAMLTDKIMSIFNEIEGMRNGSEHQRNGVSSYAEEINKDKVFVDIKPLIEEIENDIHSLQQSPFQNHDNSVRIYCWKKMLEKLRKL